MNKSFYKFVTDFGPLLVFFTFYYKNEKSKTLGTVFSLVPGLGKIYAGRTYDGMYGILNLFISLKAYLSAKKNQNKFMINIFGATSIALYASEVYGSWRALKYYQREEIVSKYLQHRSGRSDFDTQTTLKIRWEKITLKI